MTKPEFEAWEREAEQLRDQALKEYDRARDVEKRKAITEKLSVELNLL